MIERVFTNPDRIIIVLLFLALGFVIASWVVHEIEVEQNIKVVEK
jgi:hypothetical protein